MHRRGPALGATHKIQAMFMQAVVLVCVLHFVQSEMFTAIIHMEKVLHVEKYLAKELRLYIQKENQRLEKLTQVAEDYEKHSAHALTDSVTHLANPVNAFLLVKRFTSDFDKVRELINTNASNEFLDKVDKHQPDLPTSDDLNGAANALLRLQDTYKLPTETLAKGNFQGVQGSPHLTAEACFEIGKQAYNSGDHYHTILWMGEALKILECEVNKTADKAIILKHLSFSTYMQGNIHHALNMTKEWLELEPTHIRALNNLRKYEQMITDDDDLSEFKNQRPLSGYGNSEEFHTYEKLCRGDEPILNPSNPTLKCRLTHKNNPLFYLNPLREEDLYLKPWIAFYHDLLTDLEINVIKEYATPLLQRATVYNPQNGKAESGFFRVTKSAWLWERWHPLLASVKNKIQALTNLDVEMAELLQVLNYGIGGQYEPHYDFRQETDQTDPWEEMGNRIATFIAYLSNLQAGGATVFPKIGVRVVPEKGGAVFWFNLHRSGKVDYATLHAACPVLSGSKWVANKWIHERGQEFRYQCGLTPDE